jgi:hypothetical protein
MKTAMSHAMPVHLSESKAQDDAHRHAEEHQQNDPFVAMLNALRYSGGLARVHEVAAHIKKHRGNDVSPLAGWLLKRQILSFEWQSKLWIPMFQFNPAAMTLRVGLGAVLSELTTICDNWEIATWFAEPNAWLADCAPADVLASAPTQVHHAARAERFVLAG